MKIADIEVTAIHPERWGDDLDVVNAARVSFDKESEWHELGGLKEADRKLIYYLAKHKHTSPFNHSFITMRVKAPIFVARQLVKHKFLPWNEVSRRYVTAEPEFYFPERWRKAAENKKQGSSHEEIDVKWKRNEGAASERRNPCVIKFARLKWRVEALGEQFDMNIEDVEWNEVCPILGIPLNFDVARGGIFDDTPTFDRIYPEKGYTKGNVRVISDLANRMKSSASPEMLEKFARSMLLEYKGETGIAIGPKGACQKSLDEYHRLLDLGVCPEQARMVLPQNMMTEWIWSGTLGAWLDMIKLRRGDGVQEETKEVARIAYGYILQQFPISAEAYVSAN